MADIFNLVYQSITLMYQNSFFSNFSFTIVNNVHMQILKDIVIDIE